MGPRYSQLSVAVAGVILQCATPSQGTPGRVLLRVAFTGSCRSAVWPGLTGKIIALPKNMLL